MADPISAVATAVTTIGNKLFRDKDLAAKLAADSQLATLANDIRELEVTVTAAQTALAAELQGNWLQRSWRPIMMLWFGVLLGGYWFGFAPEYLRDNPDLTSDLFELLKIGIGGYIVGRSAEKVADKWKPGQK